MRDNKQLLSLLKKKRISRKQISRRRISRRRISRRRRRRRRISITAGEESEANVTCGYHGNKKTSSKRANISKLCKDYICSPSSRTSFLFMWTAGFAAFGSSTSGYGYSPPSCSGKRQSRARRRSASLSSLTANNCGRAPDFRCSKRWCRPLSCWALRCCVLQPCCG